MSGLRERKKLQTRQHIADTAARLFAERGYDAVTVDEVAQAAEVSKKTVFNYFPTKEDLVFDGVDEREAKLVAMVRDRPPGVSLIDAFREQTLEFLHFLADLAAEFQRGGLIDLVRSSPSLQRRAHVMHAQLAQTFARELAAVTGAAQSDPVPQMVAYTLLGAQRALLHECHRRLDAGESPNRVAADLEPDLHRMIALLENGFSDYARTGTSGPDQLDEVLWALADQQRGQAEVDRRSSGTNR